MSDAEKPKKIELNEIMLAMDVVDTLRHQQSLVERELGTDDHDQALIAKVRKIYACLLYTSDAADDSVLV